MVDTLPRDEFNRLQRRKAVDLAPGMRWFNPAAGTVYQETTDGAVMLTMGHASTVEGAIWTVVERDGRTLTAERSDGLRRTERVPEGATVLTL